MRSGPYPFTLRQLQYVVAVAELLSFRRAAERCHVSQPSLSTQVAQLEDALGVVLFERDQRRVMVTSAGAPLIERAKVILRESEDLLERATRAMDPLSGKLDLGVIPTISPYLLPAAAPALREALPRMTLTWTEARTDELLAALEDGRLDAALVALEAELGDVEHAIVASDPFVLALPQAHPLAKGRGPVERRELRDVDVLLLDDGHCFREQALSFCSRARAKELAFRATSLSTLVQMVASGAGATLLPALSLSTEAARADLVLRPLADPVPTRTLGLVWRKRSPLVTSLEAVARAILEAYPEPASLARRVGKGPARGGRKSD